MVGSPSVLCAVHGARRTTHRSAWLACVATPAVILASRTTVTGDWCLVWCDRRLVVAIASPPGDHFSPAVALHTAVASHSTLHHLFYCVRLLSIRLTSRPQWLCAARCKRHLGPRKQTGRAGPRLRIHKQSTWSGRGAQRASPCTMVCYTQHTEAVRQ